MRPADQGGVARGVPDAVTMGEAMRLLVAEQGVGLERARWFGSSVAGAESNVAVGLSRLGHRTIWLSRLGDDPSGRAVLRELRSEAVDTTAVEIDPQGWTGILMRDSHPERAVDVEYRRAGSAACALSADYVRRAHPPASRIVHVTGITAMISRSAHEAVLALLSWGQRCGALISFDVNLRRRLGTEGQWREVVGPIAALADLVFGGADELSVVLGDDHPEKLLLDGGAQAVVTKHPGHHATVLTADGSARVDTMARCVVDPVGAGDALVSGYLSGWLHEADPQECLRRGAVSAAAVVGAVSDIEGLPNAARHDLAAPRAGEVNR